MNQDPLFLVKLADQVASARDLARFLEHYQADVRCSPENWENLRLEMFLESMSAWIETAVANPATMGSELINQGPSWRVFAKLLLTAGIYE
jgi:hypothetical protein